MNRDLQKIVVLCVVFGVGVFVGMQFIAAPAEAPAITEKDEIILDGVDGNTDPLPKDENEKGDTLTLEPNDEPVACTADAKQCPDGSYVGRVGPNCEFAACPTAGPKTVVCTDEAKTNKVCTREYAPVCGLVQVQCITTPCDPIPETFSNGCSACAQGNVISYTTGACEV